MQKEIREEYLDKFPKGKNYLFDHMEPELADQMEQIRLGENDRKK